MFDFTWNGQKVRVPIPSVKMKSRLSDTARAVERQTIEAVLSAPDRYVRDYLTMHPNMVNTDDARELFPQYREDRTLANAVHGASRIVSNLSYGVLLQTQRHVGNNAVLFTAGGTGSGKTIAVTHLDNRLEYPIIFDSNLSGNVPSERKIKAALDQGFSIRIAYTHNLLKKAFMHTLVRAERQRREYGSGRTISVDVHLDTHYGAYSTIQHLLNKLSTDTRVEICVIDNSGDMPYIVGDPIAFLNENGYDDQNEEKERLIEYALACYKDGSISYATANGCLEQEGGVDAAIRRRA